jgi:hypothetical protein
VDPYDAHGSVAACCPLLRQSGPYLRRLSFSACDLDPFRTDVVGGHRTWNRPEAVQFVECTLGSGSAACIHLLERTDTVMALLFAQGKALTAQIL